MQLTKRKTVAVVAASVALLPLPAFATVDGHVGSAMLDFGNFCGALSNIGVETAIGCLAVFAIICTLALIKPVQRAWGRFQSAR